MRMTKRKAHTNWLSGLVHAALKLMTGGICDPSAEEIAEEFYGRTPAPSEVDSVKDALREIVDFACEAEDENGDAVWGMERKTLTPLCDQYYDGVYVPYKTRKGTTRRRKVIPRGCSDAEREFIVRGLKQDFGVTCTPIGGGKSYAGLYYSGDPLNDPICLAWIKFLARTSEGVRITTQTLIREGGGDLQTERLIFSEADTTLQEKGRRLIPAPLRQESLEEVKPVLKLERL
jgi:hypothetical protein